MQNVHGYVGLGIFYWFSFKRVLEMVLASTSGHGPQEITVPVVCSVLGQTLAVNEEEERVVAAFVN